MFIYSLFVWQNSPLPPMLNDKGKMMRDSLEIIFDEIESMLRRVSDSADDTSEIKILVKAIRSAITDKVIRYKHKYTHTRRTANLVLCGG